MACLKNIGAATYILIINENSFCYSNESCIDIWTRKEKIDSDVNLGDGKDRVEYGGTSLIIGKRGRL